MTKAARWREIQYLAELSLWRLRYEGLVQAQSLLTLTLRLVAEIPGGMALVRSRL